MSARSNSRRACAWTLLAGFALAAQSSAATAPGPFGQRADDYVMTFAEEFERGLSATRWKDHLWYEASSPTINYAVEHGALKIWPQRDNAGKFVNRTIVSDGHFAQQYGYFEIEARLPVGKGVWPAFWLLGRSGKARPEIDIMEAYPGGGPDSGWSNGKLHPTTYAVSVWRDAGAQLVLHKIRTTDLSAGFHKYAVHWEADAITFYFDGEAVASAAVRLSEPMFILLDLWFGSASGAPDDSTPQGASNAFEIRYLRAWRYRPARTSPAR